MAIVNGAEDTAHAAVGALLAGGSQACTATLISGRSLLTAAHCVDKLSPVRFFPEGLEGPVFEVAYVAVHPDYAGGNQADLAVVRLAEPLVGIDPLPLASDGPRINETVVLLGYGRTSEQGGTFGIKRAAQSRVAAVLDEYYTVAGEGNVCDGDSGGPTLVEREGREVILGVHSTKGAACGIEGYDMRVDTFLDWIVHEAEPERITSEDRTPPSVRILSPGPSARVGATLTVDVSAQDDTKVVQVVLRVDGQVAASLDTPPFAFHLEDLEEGTHAIDVTARDVAGRTAEASVRVSVSPGVMDGLFGHPCDAADECQSRVCLALDAADRAGGICSRACSIDAPCSDGFQCSEGVCRAMAVSPALPPTPALESELPMKGCQIAGAPAAADLGLLLGLLALLGARRRHSTRP
jgi:hypothetical protein